MSEKQSRALDWAGTYTHEKNIALLVGGTGSKQRSRTELWDGVKCGWESCTPVGEAYLVI